MAVAARTLVLGNAAAGAEKQALALAAAVGLPHTINARCRARSRAGCRRRRSSGASRLGGGALGLAAARAPFPQLLAISCGRAAIASSVALCAASGGRTLTVHVQRPPPTRRSSTSSSRRRTTLRAGRLAARRRACA